MGYQMTFTISDPTTWDERIARIAWSLVAEPGDTAVREFIGEGTWAEGFARLLEIKRAGVNSDSEGEARWIARMSVGNLEQQIAMHRRFGVTVLIPGDEAWPVAVDRLGNSAPFVLYARGDVARLNALPRIGFVGARAATGYGEHITVELAQGVVDRGFATVSGAAYGIDGAAHRATLAAGGTTIAVLAGGLDRYYPAGHEALLQRVESRGVVLSEVPLGTAPTKWRFLQRNRVIAALSEALVVPEAGYRSGSLNAAGHALALGVPVGAVPGPITSSASAGCHRLIHDQGAIAVSTVDEIVNLVGTVPGREVRITVGEFSDMIQHHTIFDDEESDMVAERLITALHDAGFKVVRG